MSLMVTPGRLSVRILWLPVLFFLGLCVGILYTSGEIRIIAGGLAGQIQTRIRSYLPENVYPAPVGRKSRVNTGTWQIPAQPGVIYNSTCNQLSLSQTHLPSTALATFPGSGNTWARYLIQELTGHLTGASDPDQLLERSGFPAESYTDGRVIAVKTHDEGHQHRRKFKFTQAIIVIRDPFDALVAEFHRRTKGHTGYRNQSDFISDEWEEYIKAESFRYYRFHKDWLTFDGLKLVIRFEEMKGKLPLALKSMCLFLKPSNPCTENLIECVHRNCGGSFKRPQSRDRINYHQFFPASMRRAIDQYKVNVDKIVTSCVGKKQCLSIYSP